MAHNSDISQASLSLNSAEQFQLTVTLDILHLLKKYLDIKGDDGDVIKALKQRFFVNKNTFWINSIKSYLNRL